MGESHLSLERYAEAKRVFLAASEHAVEQRQAFLDEHCADAELRVEVESLLAVFDRERSALDDPPLGSPLSEILEMALDAELMPRPPERIGNYRVVRTIAHGGMGVVYEAREDGTDRRVALKTILPGAASKQLLRRFMQEEKLLGLLSHPGIARIFEVGTFDEGGGPRPFFAMEYVDGEPLTAHARRKGVTRARRLELFAAVCDAVHHAHGLGIVHRDLKPDNIFVETPPDGARPRIKVLDFGIARALDSDVQLTAAHTGFGPMVGTLAYMSPEQLAGDRAKVGKQSDVYTLGVVLYELLCGEPPFDLAGLSLPDAIRRVSDEAPVRMHTRDRDLGGSIEAIVERAMALEWRRRYASAAELAADVRRFLLHEPVRARPLTTWYLLRLVARRHRVAVAALIATLVTLALGVAVGSSFVLESRRDVVAAAGRELEAQRDAYSSAMAAAAGALDLRDPASAARHLRATPVDLRGWEWGYLSARLERTLVELEVPGGIGRADRCAFLADGTPCLAAISAGHLQLIDVDGGPILREWSGDHDFALPTLSPDGTQVAAVSGSPPTLHVWSTETSTRVLREHLDELPRDLRFDARGATLAILRASGVTVLEIASGEQRDLELDPSRGVRLAVPGARGERLALATGQGLSLVELASGRVVQEWPGDGTRSALAFGAEGSNLAFGALDGPFDVRRVDTGTGTDLPRLRGLHARLEAVAWSADGTRLAGVAGDSLILWDARTGRILERSLLAAPGDVPALTLNGDGSRALVSGKSGVRLVALDPGPERVLEHRTAVREVAFAPELALLVSVTAGGRMRWWDADSGAALLDVPALPSGRGLGLFADGSRVVTAAAVWDTATGRRTAEPVADARAYFSLARGGARLAPDADGICRASSTLRSFELEGTARGEVVVRDARTRAELWCMTGHTAAVLAIAASPDEKLLASASADGTVRLWSLATGGGLAILDGGDSVVRALAFHPDGTRLASGAGDGLIRLWDTTSFRQVAELRGHASPVLALDFGPDGTQLASASKDRTVRVWDSIPARERRARAQAAAMARERERPGVDALLADLDDADRVAASLRAEPNRTDTERRAALRVVLERSTARPVEEHLWPPAADGVLARYDAGPASDAAGPPNPGSHAGGSWSLTGTGKATAATPVRGDLGWDAWQLNDLEGDEGGPRYQRILTERQVATARRAGWCLRIRVRLLEAQGNGVVFGYDDGPTRWTWSLGLDDEQNLVLAEERLSGTLARTVTTDSRGSEAYHLVEATYDPERCTATVALDGRIVGEGCPGVRKEPPATGANGFEEVFFGASRGSRHARAHFNLVEFAIGRR